MSTQQSSAIELAREKGTHELPSLACCRHDPGPDKQMKKDGSIEEM